MIKENALVIEAKNLYLDNKVLVDIVNDQYKNLNLYVGFCELGFCVRAKRNIKQGEVIYNFKGPTISFAETLKRGETECMSLQYGPDEYIDTEAPGRFINHSCEPNAGIINDFDLISIEDIPIHDEIRFDYSTTMDENHYRMECKCGKPNCRKIVTDFKLLPLGVRKKYLALNIVMSFIKSQY